MKHITFIGSKNVEFASRWRKEKFPEQVKYGKYLQKYEAGKYYGVSGTSSLDDSAGKYMLSSAKKWGEESRSDLKIDKTPIIQDPISNRLEKYKTDKRQQIKYKRKIFIDANQRKEFLTNVAKKRKFARAIRTGGKLGLGAVGLATVGALGYGLLRKSRNDKGKKRGSYRK